MSRKAPKQPKGKERESEEKGGRGERREKEREGGKKEERERKIEGLTLTDCTMKL